MNNYLLWLNKRFNVIKYECSGEEKGGSPKNINGKSFKTIFF